MPRTDSREDRRGFLGVSTRTNQILLLWDLGEGAELYRIPEVTDSELGKLRRIDGLFANGDLPDELEEEWEYVNAALCSFAEHVGAEHKSIAGKWVQHLWKEKRSKTMSGRWLMISTGMVP